MHRLIKICVSAAAALAMALVLAACTITSDNPLVADSEGATPLPDSFAFFPYEQGPDGYTRTQDGPATFTREGNHYVAVDMPDLKGPFDVRFVPIGDGTYLLAASMGDTPGIIYGFARYADSVLSVELAPDGETSAAIAHERANAMPKIKQALAGLSVSPQTDAITLDSRTALNYLARMYIDRRLPMGGPSVAYIGPDANSATPSRLMPDGRHWVKVP